MTPFDVVQQAWQALLAFRLRAGLSVAGVVAGIATIVTASAIGDGARREAIADIAALGIDNVYVRAGEAPTTGAKRPAPILRVADVRAIRDRIVEVRSVAGVRFTGAQVEAGPLHAAASVLGVEPAWAGIVGADVSRGRWLSERDEQSQRRVAVIGPRLATSLFPQADPIGRDVRVMGTWYRVVGVLDAPTGGRSGRNRHAIQRHDLAVAVIVPRSTMDVSLGERDGIDRVNEIAIATTAEGDVMRAATAVTALLAARIPEAGRYEVIVPRELLQARIRAQRTFNMVLLASGGLALFISGVGIMNVMLAGVAARTAEIGVRRAFGATRRDVTRQFALEALLLCLAGGLVGLPLGALLSTVVAWAAGWPVWFSPASVVLAIVLAGTVGLTCGIHPARLAARLDPAMALRAE
ncbi:MAG TPA: ABC transporter permease [Vicinamibacterales bacterium]|nr:ABC transporter permease [Vicinamibacterales bacterium]